MERQNIKSDRLIRLMKASENAGGELELIMKDALNNSKDEVDFEFIWHFNLRQFAHRVNDFYNVLAERQGYDQIKF